MTNRKRQKKKFSKYKISSKNLNIDRIKNKYKKQEDIEILEDFNNKNVLTIDNFKKVFKLLLVGCFVIAILNIGIVLTYNYILMPRIVLNGNRNITINYKEKYREKGAEATYQGKNIDEYLNIKGKVNSKKLGKYKITYSVKYKNLTRKVNRYVEVKDISKPSIIFKNNSEKVYVCPNKEYKIENYKAIDNYDGNITKDVEVNVSNDTAIYKVSDKAGNVRVINKRLIHEDVEKPKIEFKTKAPQYVYLGDEYKAERFKAIDNCDGDITDKVKVEANVDTSVPAEYMVKYTVTDKAGNKNEIKRQVIITNPTSKGTVYLTFDDGPNDGTTNVILDILKEENVKATFFVTNKGPDNLIKREYEEGHTVALHSATHDYAYIYSSVDNYFKDLKSVSDRVERITGVEPKIIRFPGGASNTISRRYKPGIMSELTKLVTQKGYKYYDWNISSDDAEAWAHTKEEIYNKVTKNLSKDKVNMVLMHDIKPYTRDAIRNIIKYCKQHGYRMERITITTDMITQHVNN